jgi:two-component system chemotaxis response regulator CheB
MNAAPRSTIRVLIVDDSAVCRDFLTHILGSDPKVEVVGTAADGRSALEATAALRPDVITMDIDMPDMNGYEVARRIMESAPTPIIVVSGTDSASGMEMSFRAIESGALTAVLKPSGGDSPEAAEQARELILMIKLMAEVKVVRRWARHQAGTVSTAESPSAPRKALPPGAPDRIEAVVIGASTGGPMPLRTILSSLPTDFPASVFVVQHISPGFGEGFAEWLSGDCRIPVRIAADGELVQKGCIYLAADEAHLGVEEGPRIRLGHGEPENGLRPSVSYLFRSAARLYRNRVIGILLSGMGKDGAEELKVLRDGGAVTFAQDELSSVVFGMPGEAVKLGGASFTMNPQDIAFSVINLVKKTDAGGQAP